MLSTNPELHREKGQREHIVPLYRTTLATTPCGSVRRGDEVADHPRTPRHTVKSPYDRRNPIPKGHGLEDGTRKGKARAPVLSSCELVSTDEGRRSGTVTRWLKLVKKFWLSWLRKQTSSRAGAHCYEGLVGASRGVQVTPSGCSAPAQKMVGLTLSQLDMNAAASQ